MHHQWILKPVWGLSHAKFCASTPQSVNHGDAMTEVPPSLIPYFPYLHCALWIVYGLLSHCLLTRERKLSSVGKKAFSMTFSDMPWCSVAYPFIRSDLLTRRFQDFINMPSRKPLLTVSLWVLPEFDKITEGHCSFPNPYQNPRTLQNSNTS